MADRNQAIIDPFTISAVLISCRANWYILTMMLLIYDENINETINVTSLLFFFTKISHFALQKSGTQLSWKCLFIFSLKTVICNMLCTMKASIFNCLYITPTSPPKKTQTNKQKIDVYLWIIHYIPLVHQPWTIPPISYGNF